MCGGRGGSVGPGVVPHDTMPMTIRVLVVASAWAALPPEILSDLQMRMVEEAGKRDSAGAVAPAPAEVRLRVCALCNGVAASFPLAPTPPPRPHPAPRTLPLIVLSCRNLTPCTGCAQAPEGAQRKGGSQGLWCRSPGACGYGCGLRQCVAACRRPNVSRSRVGVWHGLETWWPSREPG